MEDPEGDLQDPKVELLKTKRSTSVTSETTLAEGSHLDLHQVARDGNIEQLDFVLSSTFWLNKLNELDEKENSALHYAARYSHLETVKKLVATKQAVVDVEGSDGMTPLHYASRYGKNITERSVSGRTETDHDEGVQVIEALVQAGADLNKQDVWSLSPLHHASMRGNIRVVEFLTKQSGVQVDIQDKQESTPLHLAATYGNSEVARILLEAGADCKMLDYQHQNALHRAAKEGKIKVVEIIMNHLDGADIKDVMKQMDDEKSTPLILAVQAGNFEAVRIFMEKGGSAKYVDQANDKGECPLHSATRSGDKKTVEILHKYGARINRNNLNNETPLHLAAENAKELEDDLEDDESTEIVRFLVDNGARINQQNRAGISPIMIAACKGNVNVVKYLSSRDADLEYKDRNDQTIIHLAAKNDQSAVIHALLEKNDDAHYLVNENDQFDNTPLHLACQFGFLETVKVLLKYDADIDNKNEDEQTPFHLAAKHGHVDVVQCLVEANRSAIFHKDEDDNTALHLAATEKMTYTVDALLSEGASVFEKNDNNWTPLDCAAASGAYKCAELLIENGSPLDPMDRKMTTPLHLTAIHGHAQVAQLLLNHGANIALENDEGKNALELAIHHGNRNVTETILESSHWKLGLQTSNVGINQKGKEVLDTPMRMLIRTFPDITEKVLDKLITKNKDKDKEEIKQDYLDLDYQFLDDTYNFTRTVDADGSNLHYEYKDAKDRDMKQPYDSNGTTLMENHPLMLMVKHKHKHLLKHPLCIGLLRHKWKRFGRFVFYFQFLLYILFLTSVTTNVLLKMEHRDMTDGSLVEHAPEKAVQTAEDFSKWAVIILAATLLLIELSEIIRMRLDYFSFMNLLDWGLYALAIIFVLNIGISYSAKGCNNHDKCWQWPVGSFLLTASWINLLVYFRQLPFFGIYIIMFTDILKSVTKFFPVLFIFIIAFGLGFHIVIINQDPFEQPFWALVKTLVMMIGEYDFGEIFFPEPVDPTLDPFPGYSAPLFIIFVFVMSITIMNLMVGLAVDDIKQIQENAELEKLSMHVGKDYFLLEQLQPFSGKSGIGAGAVLPRLAVGP